MEVKETLREYKKETQLRIKRQSDIKRVVIKGGILNADEASHRIKNRRKEEVEQAQRKILFKEKCLTQSTGLKESKVRKDYFR